MEAIPQVRLPQPRWVKLMLKLSRTVIHSSEVPPPKVSTAFPNSVTSWGPSIQAREPIRDISHSPHSLSICYLSIFLGDLNFYHPSRFVVVTHYCLFIFTLLVTFGGEHLFKCLFVIQILFWLGIC